MKNLILTLLSVLLISPAVLAEDPQRNKKKTKKETIDDTKINWMSLGEVEAAMVKKPKKVFIDVYTDWCGWCKVMDKKTFSNKEVIKYMNEHFYAVKLNAEQKDTIRFKGKSYGFVPQYRSNQLAAELLAGRMSYPSFVIMEEHFQNPMQIAGYQNVSTMEKILKYIAGNIYKTTQYPEYEKTFVGTWKEAPAAAQPVKAGH